MKASTHTEIYRPFEGELKRRPLRFFAVSWAGIRPQLKKKLPLLLLFAPPAISSIVFSVIVWVKFQFAPGSEGMPDMDVRATAAMASAAAILGEVSDQIVSFVTGMRWFCLLAITWFGAGLIAEDRRLGAYVLYFSRPITRLDYIIGKGLAVAFFGVCALVVPALLICNVAAFASPEWSFVTEQGDVILKTIAYCMLWVVVLTSIALCVSSLVESRNLALAGTFGAVLLTEAVGNLFFDITSDERFLLVSLFANFERAADWMFGHAGGGIAYAAPSLWVIGGIVAVSLTVLVHRVRRMEVVA